jgi:NAD(P)-dependent dehydrogenase (short-subunit alcohol dehydrogenase family)
VRPPPGSAALVTGGARGLGVEVCRQLAQAGIVVWLTARDAENYDTGERALKRRPRPGPPRVRNEPVRSLENGPGVRAAAAGQRARQARQRLQPGRPVADGARSVTWACLLADDGPTGGFFRDGRPLPW